MLGVPHERLGVAHERSGVLHRRLGAGHGSAGVFIRGAGVAHELSGASHRCAGVLHGGLGVRPHWRNGAPRGAHGIPRPCDGAPRLTGFPFPNMTWDQGTWDSGFWDEPASDYFQTKPKTPHSKMKRQNFYPSRIANQVTWLDNYRQKITTYGPICGVIAADVTATVNDARFCEHVLGSWLSAVRAFAPSTTDAVDDVLTGGGTSAVVLPAFTAPALPAGVTAALPGALTRIFALIAKMKLHAGYTEAIGTDLGVVGPEETEKPVPKFLTDLLQGGGCQCVKLTFYKYTHMGVYIESRRGTGAWDLLGIDTESPYLDERPLLAAGQPEVREYRMRFWDKGTPNGDWTDVVKVTVSP